MGVVLQKRDLEILNICYEQMFMSVAQVERYFFTRANQRRARERVLELERAGYISRKKIYGETPTTLLRLTPSGLSIVSKRNEFQINPRSKIDLATLEHDLRLIDIRMRLDELWTNYVWVPEKAIRRAEYPEVPDAISIFSSGRIVAIELENSMKAEERIVRLLSRWRNTDVSLVLYFTTNSGIFKKFQKIIKAQDFETPIALVDIEAFFTSRPIAWTKEGEIHVFE